MSQVAQGQLRSFVERIERLNEELDALNADKKEVYAEAKGNGFDVKTLKAVISARRKEPAELQEEQAMFDVYWHALNGSSFSVDNNDKSVNARACTRTRDAETISGRICEPETGRVEPTVNQPHAPTLSEAAQ